MKKYMFFGIVCLNLIFQNEARAQFASPEELKKVHSAIEASDVTMVENFFKDYVLKDTKEKKGLLEKAITTLAEKQQRIRLLKSPWDLAKLTSGALLTTVGGLLGGLLGYIVYDDGLQAALKNLVIRPDTKKINYAGIALMLSSPLSLGSGIFLATKGWRCSTALNRCENAKRIKELIEEAQVA